MDERDGLLVPSLLMSNDAEQVQGIGMSGRRLQDLPIIPLGLVQPARFVTAQGQRQRFRNSCHHVGPCRDLLCRVATVHHQVLGGDERGLV